MATHVLTGKRPAENVLRHEARLRLALERCRRDGHQQDGFDPGTALPVMSDRLREFFSVAELSFTDIGTYQGKRLVLLDLMRNPATRTTKTLASLVIVARAVRYIQDTGERVMIVSPSSANKATGLRDAVLRAYETGLATPDELRIVTLVPDVARDKLWSSDLSDNPVFAAANPLCVQRCPEPAQVKETVRAAVLDCAGAVRDAHGFNLWYTLDLDNYRGADAVRAFAERDALPQRPGISRAHAHAVSSAFGLLGHHFGTTLLPETVARPAYFLVQHLATPDMVCGLYGTDLPAYELDRDSGLYHQQSDPRFPLVTEDPGENLEPTFYTKRPATSAAMNEIIRQQGGGGIVVSKHECLTRYQTVRAMLSWSGIQLPVDPGRLREWSLVMAMTGVLNAIDRRLLGADEVVVHGSGCYVQDDFTALSSDRLHPVSNAADLARVITAAASR